MERCIVFWLHPWLDNFSIKDFFHEACPSQVYVVYPPFLSLTREKHKVVFHHILAFQRINLASTL